MNGKCCEVFEARMSEFACLQWDSETGNGINLTIQTWLPFFPARPFSRRPPAGFVYVWVVCVLLGVLLAVRFCVSICMHTYTPDCGGSA